MKTMFNIPVLRILLIMAVAHSSALAELAPHEGEVDSSGWPKGMKQLANAKERISGYFVNAADYFFFSACSAESVGDFVSGEEVFLENRYLPPPTPDGAGQGFPQQSRRVPAGGGRPTLRGQALRRRGRGWHGGEAGAWRGPAPPYSGRESQNQTKEAPIHIESLLRRLHPIKRFVYARCGLEEVGGRDALVADVVPRANSRPRCSGCGRAAPGYDRMQEPRLFRFVPLWGVATYLRYTMRRVSCRRCGVVVEAVPWASGKHSCCDAMRCFLASWAKRLSWSDVARCFRTSWDTVYRSVSWAVSYGLEHRDLEGVRALGVDEVAKGRGHDYMTLVYEIGPERRRLLGVVEGRKAKSLLRFFRDFGRERCARVEVVCSDMWRAYLKVVAKKLPNALNVLDRFHVAKKLGEAVDQVRRSEAGEMRRAGFDPVLGGSRYCFLKRIDNLTDNQLAKLSDLVRYNLRTVRAWLLKESFDAFWHYNSPRWARWFLRKWCARAMRSRLDPFKAFVKTLRSHEELLMNYFKAAKQYNSGIVEGLNLRVKLGFRKAFGYRSFNVTKVALLHQLGDLPPPPLTHRFCE